MIIDGAERGFPLAWDEIFSDAVPKEVWLSIPHPDGTKEAKRGSIWELDEKQTHNGLDVHLSEIRSHEKLTGEGMTFVRTRLVQVIEDVLPARFGGACTDFQVLEEEGQNGILRLYLLASPRLGQLDEAEIKQAFLAELGRGSEVENFMARVWERAGTIEVRRQAPVATRGGKVLPFHLLREAG